MAKYKFVLSDMSEKVTEQDAKTGVGSSKASVGTQSWEPRPSAYNIDLVESMRQSQEFEATFRFADKLLRQG